MDKQGSEPGNSLGTRLRTHPGWGGCQFVRRNVHSVGDHRSVLFNATPMTSCYKWHLLDTWWQTRTISARKSRGGPRG